MLLTPCFDNKKESSHEHEDPQSCPAPMPKKLTAQPGAYPEKAMVDNLDEATEKKVPSPKTPSPSSQNETKYTSSSDGKSKRKRA